MCTLVITRSFVFFKNSGRNIVESFGINSIVCFVFIITFLQTYVINSKWNLCWGLFLVFHSTDLLFDNKIVNDCNNHLDPLKKKQQACLDLNQYFFKYKIGCLAKLRLKLQFHFLFVFFIPKPNLEQHYYDLITSRRK